MWGLDQIQWANWDYIYLFIMAFVILALYIYHWLFRKRLAERVTGRKLLDQMILRKRGWRSVVSVVAFMLALSFIIVSAMRPRYGLKEVTVKGKGIDICFVLDVSRSMKAQDVAPDRITSAIAEITKILDGMQGNRVSLVPFAGIAFVQSPLTLDYGVIKEYLREIKVTDIPVQGTALGRALTVAKSALGIGGHEKTSSTKKMIIVFTDGENHEGDPVSVAKELGSENVRIITVGVGTPAGQPLPILDENGVIIGTAREKDGTTPILSKLNEDLLKEIANATQGKYLSLHAQSNITEDILKEIAAMEKAEFQGRVDRLREDRFQIPLAVAIIFMFVPFLIQGGGGVRIVIIFLFISANGYAKGWLDKAHGGVEEALNMLAEGKAGDAAKSLSDLSSELKDRPDLLYDLAIAREKAGQLSEALQAIDEAITITNALKQSNPDFPTLSQLYHARGTILVRQAMSLPDDKKVEAREMYRKAVDAFTQALLLEPDRVDTLRNLEIAAIPAYPPCSKMDDNAEQNDTQNEARFLAPDPNTMIAKMDLLLCPDNQDWFRIPLNKGETLFASVQKPTSTEENIEPALVNLEIFDENSKIAGPEKNAIYKAKEDKHLYFLITGPKEEDGIPYRLEARIIPACPKGDDSFEDNDTKEMAKSIPEGRHAGRICPSDDDWFQFVEKKGEQKQIVLEVLKDEGQLKMEVFSTDGSPLDIRYNSLQNGEGMMALAILPKAENEAPFFIRIYGEGREGFYTLNISNPQGGDNKQDQEQTQEKTGGSQTLKDLLEDIDKNEENLEAKEALRLSPYREYLPEKDW